MSPNESPHRSSSARPGTMKAARVHQWGTPEVITVESVDLPEPANEELLVRVHAAGVGPWDALVRSGKIGLPLTLPLTLGSEVSGAVEKVARRQPVSLSETRYSALPIRVLLMATRNTPLPRPE
jgi:hypothetical protein